MDFGKICEFIPFLCVLGSLIFSRRYYRHTLALIGAIWATILIPSDHIFSVKALIQSPLECFWVGMTLFNAFFLFHALWTSFIPLSEEHRLLYYKFFRKFSRYNFKKLMEIAQFENKAHGALLIKQGECMDYIMCIIDGAAGVVINGEKRAVLKNGDFIGEMSFLSGNLSSATVRTEVLSTIIIWKQSDLKDLLRKNPTLLVEFNRVIERQLANKLIFQNRKI